MKIDYKGGNLFWDLLPNWENGGGLHEDMVFVEYDSCKIDVGHYGRKPGKGFEIQVVETNAKCWDPIVIIPCKDKDDMYAQLQRAIDIYPEMLKGEVK